MTTFLSHHYIPYILGFGFSIFGGKIFVGRASKKMWEGHKAEPYPWQPVAVGLTERAAYTATILAGQSFFIPLWIGAKTVSQWGRWQEAGVFNNFLLGTLLSIGYGAAGAQIVIWLNERRWVPALLVPTALVVGTVCLTRWIPHGKQPDPGPPPP